MDRSMINTLVYNNSIKRMKTKANQNSRSFFKSRVEVELGALYLYSSEYVQSILSLIDNRQHI